MIRTWVVTVRWPEQNTSHALAVCSSRVVAHLICRVGALVAHMRGYTDRVYFVEER